MIEVIKLDVGPWPHYDRAGLDLEAACVAAMLERHAHAVRPIVVAPTRPAVVEQHTAGDGFWSPSPACSLPGRGHEAKSGSIPEPSPATSTPEGRGASHDGTGHSRRGVDPCEGMGWSGPANHGHEPPAHQVVAAVPMGADSSAWHPNLTSISKSAAGTHAGAESGRFPVRVRARSGTKSLPAKPDVEASADPPSRPRFADTAGKEQPGLAVSRIVRRSLAASFPAWSRFARLAHARRTVIR